MFHLHAEWDITHVNEKTNHWFKNSLVVLNFVFSFSFPLSSFITLFQGSRRYLCLVCNIKVFGVCSTFYNPPQSAARWLECKDFLLFLCFVPLNLYNSNKRKKKVWKRPNAAVMNPQGSTTVQHSHPSASVWKCCCEQNPTGNLIHWAPMKINAIYFRMYS